LFIRSKMEAYKNSCTDEELKYFRVLEKKYLTEKKYSIFDIAEEEKVDRATVYRYLGKAITELPVVFFGVDAIQFR
jgi:transposase-like protein